MSQHPSLRSKTKDALQRSVLKRYERIKALNEKEEWNEGESVYGLPKQKIVKFKIKKEKTEAPAEPGAEGQTAAAESAPKDAVKADTKAKGKGGSEPKKQ